MEHSINATSNQPTIFIQWKKIGQATAEVLGMDFLEHSFPQTTEELATFDWESVVPEDPDTCPPGFTPSNKDYEMVRTVHLVVKDEKDAEARALGDSESGVQSCIAHRQKWGKWRLVCAVFKFMNPEMENQTVIDLMTFSLKLCPSKDAIFDVLQVLVKKHKKKLARDKKNAEKKTTLDQELAAIQNRESEAKTNLDEAAKVHEEVLDEKKQAEDAAEADTTATSTQHQRQARKATVLREVNEREKEVADELKQATMDAAATLKQKEDLTKQKAAIEKEPVEPPKMKKAKRNDPSLLLEKMTPRQRVGVFGDKWKPQTRIEGRTVTHSSPGEAFIEESTHKLELLASLAHHLKSDGPLDQPFAFLAIVECIGADQRAEECDFHARVFICIVALVLHEPS